MLIQVTLVSHLVLASQIQPIQLFVTLPPSSSKQTSVPKIVSYKKVVILAPWDSSEAVS